MGVLAHEFLGGSLKEGAVNNEGISFGLKFGGELILSLLVFLAVLIVFLREKEVFWGWMGILAGGGINWWDRINYGYVRDYWKLPGVDLYNNLADWGIFIGIMILVIEYIFKKIMVKIVFEDDCLVVVDKPAGMVTTNEGNVSENTLENWSEENLKTGLSRGGIVHRLDKGTSGLVIIAKNTNCMENLQNQFKKRIVKKFYVALLGGDLPFEGEVLAPIKRSKYVFGKWGVDPDGKSARTLFKVLDKYKNDGKIYSLVEIELKTGRTHQIRVHFNYLGWPLVGDKTYGGKDNFGLGRPFLEAKRLKFIHPKKMEPVEFNKELSMDLRDHLKLYEKI